MNDKIEWTAFMRGFVFWETPRTEFAPLDPGDTVSLAEWLQGFCQAHADYPADGDFEGGESAAEALDRLLAGHPARVTLEMMLRPM